MDRSVLEQQVINLLKLHEPVKARNLAKILSDEFGLHIDRSDVNSVLYQLKTKEIAVKNDAYAWRLVKTYTHHPEKKPSLQAAVHFTSEQQAIIDLDPTEHLLIRGQAGSGKTTVLAARAGRIVSAMSKGSLLFLTYNAALTAYVKRSFQQLGMQNDIDVKTFHEWARSTARALGADFVGWVNTKSRNEQLEKCIEEARNELGEHRLFQLEDSPHLLTWWSEEIAWLFGQHVTRLSEYWDIERRGRGIAIRLSREDREFVWEVFDLYVEWLEETRQEDYDNPAGLLLRTLMEQGADMPDSLRYDHVMIDEVQDFDKSWLLAVVKVPHVSLSLAGDLAQKIYHRNFSWSSVGINVRGRSRSLSASHRTTQQIMDVAEYLLDDQDITKSSDYFAPTRPSKHGDKVKVVLADNARSAYEHGYDWIAEQFRRIRTTTVVVALPFSRQLYPAKQALQKRGVKAENVKGVGLGNFEGGVAVTTYHQLKGLEFDHVVIMGLHDVQYPGRLLNNIPEEDQLEEEQLLQRVLYVAMTRAKKSVALVGSEPFCRFFNDIPDELFEVIDATMLV